MITCDPTCSLLELPSTKALVISTATPPGIAQVDYCSVVQANNAHGLLSKRVRSTGTRTCPAPSSGYVRVGAASCAAAPSHPCPNCDPLHETGCNEVVAYFTNFIIPCTDTDLTYMVSLERFDGTWQDEGTVEVGPSHEKYDTIGTDGFPLQMSQEGTYRIGACARAGNSPSVCSTSDPFTYDEMPPAIGEPCLLLGPITQCGTAFLSPDLYKWQDTALNVRLNGMEDGEVSALVWAVRTAGDDWSSISPNATDAWYAIGWASEFLLPADLSSSSQFVVRVDCLNNAGRCCPIPRSARSHPIRSHPTPPRPVQTGPGSAHLALPTPSHSVPCQRIPPHRIAPHRIQSNPYDLPA